jgi:glycosyltransferase involved in cell wall biosynthesis
MRIALVAPHASPISPQTPADDRTGVTTLARTLGSLGHKVTVYARKDSPSQPRTQTVASGVTVEHVPAGPPERVPADQLKPHIREFGEYLADRWRRNPPDLAHAHFWMSGLAALAGARDRDVPVVQTFHSVGRPAAPGRLGLDEKIQLGDTLPGIRLKVSLARHVRGVLARSWDEMMEVAGWGVPRAAISVVPWGVDTGQFTPDGPVARRNGRPRLLTVSRLATPQDTEIVVRALTEVPDAELLVAGGPPRDDLGDSRAYRVLAKLTAELGVADRVTFTGAVSMKALPALLRSADLLVSQGWEEPFDTIALQAMACGTPVIGPPGGCYQDAVIDGTTGVLVAPGHPSALARQVRELLASPLRLEAFGIAAADRARARYSWERIGQETASAYERCLAARHGQDTSADLVETTLAAAGEPDLAS